MSASLLLAAALCAASMPSGDVRYVEVTLDFEAGLLDQRFVELEEDGPRSLSVALRLAGGKRELRLYSLTARGLDTTPAHIIPVLEDVIAYGFADVREEPGRELIFLTRSGAWSYSLTKDGYRGNIARLVEDELLYDVPDNRSLRFWKYMLPVEGGDHVLLPGSGGYSIWGPRTDGEEIAPRAASYVDVADFWARPRAGEATMEGRGEVRVGEGGFSVTMRDEDDVFLGEDAGGRALLSDSKAYDAPALIDVDGDGELDLVKLVHDDELHVHLSRNGVIPVEPTRVEEYPEYIGVGEERRSIRFADLDGDGRKDLYVKIEGDVDGFENAEQRLLFLINDGKRLFPEKPRQVMRFEAAELTVNLVDVDGDERPDLVLRKFELPSMLEAVTGLEFNLTHLVYLSTDDDDALFERRPALKQTQTFNENTVGDAIKNRRLRYDCSGDGIPDLVEVDLQGRIAIRRLTLDSGFFSGDTWELDEAPWKRFETRGTILSIFVDDVNDDDLCDILSPGERSLTLLLSQWVR